MMKRVLVTGGSGLIGRHCLPLLTRLGYEVHAVTRGLSLDIPGVEWHCRDLHESGAAQALMSGIRPTHLLHLAWYTEPSSFWSSPENRTWLDISLALCRSFEQLGGERLVATGSCAEYQWPLGPCGEFMTPCRPSTAYGRAKLALASYLDAMFSSGSLSTAWARLFFVYGPHASSRRMPGVVISALSRGEPVACSAGTQERDFLYVSDVADAVVTLLDSNVGGPINICSGHALTIQDLALQVADMMGRRDLLRLGAIATASHEPPLIVGDPSRLRDELHWQPRHTLVEGLRETIAAWTSPSISRVA